MRRYNQSKPKSWSCKWNDVWKVTIYILIALFLKLGFEIIRFVLTILLNKLLHIYFLKVEVDARTTMEIVEGWRGYKKSRRNNFLICKEKFGSCQRLHKGISFNTLDFRNRRSCKNKVPRVQKAYLYLLRNKNIP